MAHMFAAHRRHIVEKARVGHIAHGHKHRASGGKVHGDEKQDRKLFKEMMHEHEVSKEGKHAKHRRDRVARAKGGRVGKKGKGATHVNVIVGGQHANPPAPPMPAPMPPPPAAAAPPPAPPPGAGLGGPWMPPGGPPMPMRARGGPIEAPMSMKPAKAGGKMCRARGGPVEAPGHEHTAMPPKRAKGGPIEAPDHEHTARYRKRGGKVAHSIKSGPAWDEGLYSGTQVQHSPALSDTLKNMDRRRPVTFKSGGKVVSFHARARGGPIESTNLVDSATENTGGGGGGRARREKISKYGYGKPMRGENQAR